MAMPGGNHQRAEPIGAADGVQLLLGVGARPVEHVHHQVPGAAFHGTEQR
jgi:hypothetical protein